MRSESLGFWFDNPHHSWVGLEYSKTHGITRATMGWCGLVRVQPTPFRRVAKKEVYRPIVRVKKAKLSKNEERKGKKRHLNEGRVKYVSQALREQMKVEYVNTNMTQTERLNGYTI